MFALQGAPPLPSFPSPPAALTHSPGPSYHPRLTPLKSKLRSALEPYKGAFQCLRECTTGICCKHLKSNCLRWKAGTTPTPPHPQSMLPVHMCQSATCRALRQTTVNQRWARPSLTGRAATCRAERCTGEPELREHEGGRPPGRSGAEVLPTGPSLS